TRDRPFATVGYTMAGVNTPSSHRSPESFTALASSPATTGVIGVSLAPVSKPRSCSPFLKKVVFDHSRSIRSGSSRITSRAAMQAAATGGGALVEKRNGRPRSEEHTSELQSRSDLVCRLLLE